MIDVVSGIPTPQLGDESLSQRIRVGSRFKLLLCFALIDIRYFAYPLRCLRLLPRVREPQVEAHCSRLWRHVVP
jgi:hypothetical protein